jgi:hypothetical protein
MITAIGRFGPSLLVAFLLGGIVAFGEDANLGYDAAAATAKLGKAVIDENIAARDSNIQKQAEKISNNKAAIAHYEGLIANKPEKKKAEAEARYQPAINELQTENANRQKEIERLQREKAALSQQRAGVSETGSTAANGIAATTAANSEPTGAQEHGGGGGGSEKSSPTQKSQPMMPPPSAPPPPPPPPPAASSSSDSKDSEPSPPPPPPPPPPPVVQNEQVVDNGELMAAIEKLSAKKEVSTEKITDPTEAAAAKAADLAAQIQRTGDAQVALVDKQKAQVAASSQIPNSIDSARTQQSVDTSSRGGGSSALGSAMAGGVVGGSGSGGYGALQRETASSAPSMADRLAALSAASSGRGRAMMGEAGGVSGGDDKAGDSGGSLDLSAMMGGAMPDAEAGVGPDGTAIGGGGPGALSRSGARGVINLNAPALPGPLGVVMRDNKFVAGSTRPIKRQ